MNKTNSKFASSSDWFVILSLIIPFFIVGIKNGGYLFEGKKLNFIVNNIINSLQLNLSFNDGILLFSLALFLRILLFLLPFLVITTIELRNRKFKDTTLGRIQFSEGYKYADLWYFSINQIIRSFGQITILTTMGLIIVSKEIQSVFQNIYSNIFPQPNSSTFAVILLLLSAELIKYSVHRFAHSKTLLWDLHEFHHSATEMTIFSQQRNFAIEGVFTGFIFIPFSVLISSALSEAIVNGNFLTIGIYFFDLIMTDFFAYIGHSSLKLVYPKPISYIYMSPSLHWLHHSKNRNHWECNFGEKYPFWDKLFGTYLDESHLDEIKQYGIEGGSEYNKHHPIYTYTIVPILKIIKRIGIYKTS